LVLGFLQYRNGYKKLFKTALVEQAPAKCRFLFTVYIYNTTSLNLTISHFEKKVVFFLAFREFRRKVPTVADFIFSLPEISGSERRWSVN
jgi:hypothetical protein